MDLHTARFEELDAASLLAILKLRSAAFVVEQHCVYTDMDGRDELPDTVHMWLSSNGEIATYLRILSTPDGARRVGRVVTAPAFRGQRLAGQLMEAALAHIGPDVPVVLNAQAHLETFYNRFGFTVSGPGHDEDGIPHVPMRRPASSGR